MRITITGAAGLVGGALARRLAGEHDVTALSHAELDIADRGAVEKRLLDERPELILNAAAVGVDLCESDPGLARRVNVAGPESLARFAERCGSVLVHFSTNYAFGGEPVGRLPYTLEDPTAPLNVYGSTKVEGEGKVRSACPRSFVIRTSWVFGPGKESFLSTAHRRLRPSRQPARAGRAENRKNRRLRAIGDVWASATYIEHLVTRVLEIVGRGTYGTYHIVNEGCCSYLDFAREAAHLVGRTEAEASELIEETTAGEMFRQALRPRWTPMQCLLSRGLGLAPMPTWREGLEEYVRSDGAVGGRR